MAEDAAKIFWERQASLLALRINLAAWLDGFAPALFAVSTVGGIILYLFRRSGLPIAALMAGLGVVVPTVAVIVWRRTRRYRHRRADGFILLESALGLESRLSAAVSGVVAWPPPAEAPRRVVRRKSHAATATIALSLGLLIAGLLAPLPATAKTSHPFSESPPSLLQTQEALEQLAKLNVTDPVTLERMADEARALAVRPVEEQYTHSGLEAADALRDQAMEAISKLGGAYESAAAALDSPEAEASGGSDASSRAGADAQLGKALDGMKNGRLGGNRDLTDALEALRHSSDRNSAQARSLADRLSSAGAQLRGVQGALGSGAPVAERSHTKVQWSRGPGGTGGGTEEAPLTMNEDPSTRLEGQLKPLTNADMSRASLGDLVSVENGGAPRPDTQTSPLDAAGGTLAGKAQGGEAVWIDRLTPADRAVIQKLFK